MNLSRNAARALNFAVITVIFLLLGSFLDTISPAIAFAAAILQIVLFIVIDRVFKIESKTKMRMIFKFILAAIGIFAVTYTVLGILDNSNYAVYTYGDTKSTVSFLTATADTTSRIIYAAIQLLPVLMFLSLVFDKAFFFPAASLYTYLCILANNTTAKFGPFSEYNGIVREYAVSNSSVSVGRALMLLLLTSIIVTGIDLCIHRPKKKHKTKYVLVLVCLVLAVIFTLLFLISKGSGASFNIDSIKESHGTMAAALKMTRF